MTYKKGRRDKTLRSPDSAADEKRRRGKSVLSDPSSLVGSGADSSWPPLDRSKQQAPLLLMDLVPLDFCIHK